jgi:ribosomal protein S18 acetylase RimI-like enzyme
MRAASMAGERDRAWLLAHPDAIEVPAEAIDDGRVRVAVDPAGRRLGFSVVLPIAGGACELDGLFVAPEAMRRGVGSALVRDAAARARAQGAERIDVIANDNALGFYERMGFRGGEWVPTRHRPALRMSLPLTGPAA